MDFYLLTYRYAVKKIRITYFSRSYDLNLWILHILSVHLPLLPRNLSFKVFPFHPIPQNLSSNLCRYFLNRSILDLLHSSSRLVVDIAPLLSTLVGVRS